MRFEGCHLGQPPDQGVALCSKPLKTNVIKEFLMHEIIIKNNASGLEKIANKFFVAFFYMLLGANLGQNQ